MASNSTSGSFPEFSEYALLEAPLSFDEEHTDHGAHPVLVFAVDGKLPSEQAFKQYCQMVHKPHYCVHVLYIVHIPFNQSGISEAQVTQLQVDAAFRDGCKQHENIEHKFTAIMKQYDVKGKFQFIPGGSPGECLVRYADKVHATAIITGTNDRGLVHRILKPSVSRYVQKHAHCNVMSIKDKKYRATRRNRTVSDSSDTSQRSYNDDLPSPRE